MKDKDFIKWLIHYAEGFELNENSHIKCPDKTTFLEAYFIIEHPVYYPLLLQRAIEGINKESEYIEIYQNQYNIWFRYKDNKCGCWSRNYNFCFNMQDWFLEELDAVFNTPEKAKEKALKYIYEKENN